jgi:acetyltransferase-like isoleucine patch superfamily enzyme
MCRIIWVDDNSKANYQYKYIMYSIGYLWAKFFKKLGLAAVRKSQIHPTSVVESGSNVLFSSFGKYTYCGYDCEIVHTEIGNFTSISNNVHIGGGMHPIEWVGTSPVFYDNVDSIKKKFSRHQRPPVAKTFIGHDVWIGQSVLIKQGVVVGNGAVIGMGSVVTKNVEPYTIVAGNPARIIKKRFSEEVIEALEKTKWFEWEDEELQKYAPDFTDVQTFLSKVNNNKV